MKSRLILLVLAFAVMFVGCKQPAANVAPPQAMRQVTDDLGRKINVPVKITRAVSLAPNLTESIFAVGAGDRLVGVTTFCDYPEEAKSIAKVGDTMNPNVESIVALKPEVVFVSTASQIEAFTKTLEANGIAIYVTNPLSLRDIWQNLRDLGNLFETSEIAKQATVEMGTREVAVKSKLYAGREVRKISVFVQISKEPLFTVGGGSFISDIINEADGVLLTNSIRESFPKLSKETAATMNPEAIILSESEDNQEPNEVFKNSPAVKNGRVYKVNADLLSRPGPRLVDALEQIAKDLHPEKFK